MIDQKVLMETGNDLSWVRMEPSHETFHEQAIPDGNLRIVSGRWCGLLMVLR